MVIDNLPGSKPVQVFVILGPGGVGKTTVCSALALSLAAQKRRVLALTVDPARRLADSLGIGSEASDPVRISRERLVSAGFGSGLDVFALVLDPKRTFDGLVQRYASSERARERIMDNPFYDYVSRYLAGVHEYMAIERLFGIIEVGDFDAIVLDTPPADDALAFLDAPARLSHALDQSALRWLMQGFDRGSGLRLGLLARGVASIVRSLSRVTGGELLEGLARLLVDLNDLFGGFEARASAMNARLRDRSCRYLLVSGPDELNLTRVQRLARELVTRDMNCVGTIINRCTTPLPRIDRPQMRAVLDTVCDETMDVPRLLDVVDEAVALQREGAKLEAENLAHYDAQRDAPPVLCKLAEQLDPCADLAGLRALSTSLSEVAALSPRD